ncbi:DNA-binding PadR family transcriptional regulator [Actinomycetospora succinea]|uniref:DNA-binding PadR family transcriptional regulator n=1 Tax=Actinomycetospora succinea TaxID=663603 RepID=A0A4R6VE05_9PSEU|nr:PadR family transcriptional regulator [Actinomycetospora succinea]TDQ61043.1 DNA-binding PadR family transcriptional regulator [Actinomycetospora succinea]
MLELAVLGLLHEAPMHGYQLRKQLHARLGTFRAFSWGSLYPTLRRLQRAGLIAETSDAPAEGTEEGAETAASARSRSSSRGSWGSKSKTRRGRRVFELTAEGKDRFDELLAEVGPQAWDDESFGIHLAFFSRTPVEVRMRILEGRRRQVEERREGLRSTLSRAGEQIDHYTRELHRIGLESTEREVRWLNELIAAERGETPPPAAPPTPDDEPGAGARPTPNGA